MDQQIKQPETSTASATHAPADDAWRLGAGMLIHIGYPKCASTWLQQNVFNSPEIGTISPWGERAPAAIEDFVLSDDFDFDPARVRQKMEPGLRDARARGLTPVLSEQTLIGDICSEKYWGYHTLNKIHQTFPQARIFLCIREQSEIIYSAYCEYVDAGFSHKLSRFIGAESLPPGVGAVCARHALKYDRIIDRIRELYGPESLLVLPLKLLKYEPEEYSRLLLNFMGLQGTIPRAAKPANIAYGAATVLFQRRVNGLLPSMFVRNRRVYRLMQRLYRAHEAITPKFIHRRRKARMMRMIHDHTRNYYNQSNQRTSELIGINLEKFGYAI